MMLRKCCTQYASKVGKLSSGHRTGKGHKATNDFKGNLFFVDLLGDNSPDYKGFGARYSLLYVSENERMPAGLMV